MDEGEFDDIAKKIGRFRNRRDTLKTLGLGLLGAAGLGAGLEAEAKGKGKKSKGKNAKGKQQAASKGKQQPAAKGKGQKGHHKGHSVKAATVTTNIQCACAANLSPKGCPNPGSQPQYTCKAAASGTGCGVDTNNAPQGSVQVGCNGNQPYCYCNSTNCVVNGVKYKKGGLVGACNPVSCPSVSCDDHISCTVDTCNTSTGFCERTLDNSKCDDSNACTTDTCDPTNQNADPTTGCVHAPVSCDDGKVCTTDSCDPATGCKHEAVVCSPPNACKANCTCSEPNGCSCEDLNCDDSNACTADSCDPATGCVHTPINCDDGNACTVDSCDPKTGCVYTPISCDDGNACTADSCDPATGCVHTPISCDDGDACTIDTCDPKTGCVHTPVVCPDKQGCVNNGCSNGTCQYSCTCVEGESAKGCPTNTSPKYTCKRCPGLTGGSPQVTCNGSTPSCVCNDQGGCTINDVNYPRGTDLTAGGICEPVNCSTGNTV